MEIFLIYCELILHGAANTCSEVVNEKQALSTDVCSTWQTMPEGGTDELYHELEKPNCAVLYSGVNRAGPDLRDALCLSLRRQTQICLSIIKSKQTLNKYTWRRRLSFNLCVQVPFGSNYNLILPDTTSQTVKCLWTAVFWSPSFDWGTGRDQRLFFLDLCV